tara:strand:- start:177 stop:779 length:603 start_codon:yes stop_codon:yes gene_type:complete
MSYDRKIMDQKFHVKNLIDENMCKNLIQFYEDKIDMATPEESYKFEQDKIMLDNFGCLNLSQFKDNMGFQGPYDIIINYIRKVVADYEQYVKNTLCPSFRNVFFTNTRNIRILKYDVGQCIKDHSDIDGYTRGSLTINLNDDYEGGEFRFFDGQEKVKLSRGEAMLFPAEPIWIHGTEPITKGVRYSINCFLRMNDEVRQ